MKYQLITAALLSAASVSAQAATINTSLSGVAGATTIGFEAFDGLINTTGSINLGSGVTFTADVDAELSPSTRDLGGNGLWTFGLNGFAASGSNGVMTFGFDSLKSGVSAFISHQGGGTVLVEALGAGNTLLESTTVSFTAPNGFDGYDEGTYIGFLRSGTDIQALRLSGVGVVADNLTAAVPEPESYALALAGLCVMGLLARRRAH